MVESHQSQQQRSSLAIAFQISKNYQQSTNDYQLIRWHLHTGVHFG
jgi:hypothetical protein